MRIFPSDKDIPDTPEQVQLAVINPSYCNQQSHTLQQDLVKLYNGTDNNAKDARRQNLNNIVLLVAKSNNWPRLEEAIARQMAAQFVKERLGRTITSAQEDELSKITEAADTLIIQEICTHWSELYYPSISSHQIGGAPLGHTSIASGTTAHNGQQPVIDALVAVGKVSPNDVLDQSMVWNRMGQLNDPGNPPTVKALLGIFAGGPGHTMMLNKDVLLRVIANAVKASHLVVQTDKGQTVQNPDGRLLTDDCVIYRAGNEPALAIPPIPELPDDGNNSTDSRGAGLNNEIENRESGGEQASTTKPTEFNDTGAVANSAVQLMDSFMAQHGYTLTDAVEVRIIGTGEPLLTYLVGLFSGENAVCEYTSSGNQCDLIVKVPVKEYAAKKMLWQNFKTLTGDDGSSTITITPSPDGAGGLHDKLRQMTNQTIDLRVRFV